MWPLCLPYAGVSMAMMTYNHLHGGKYITLNMLGQQTGTLLWEDINALTPITQLTEYNCTLDD